MLFFSCSKCKQQTRLNGLSSTPQTSMINHNVINDIFIQSARWINARYMSNATSLFRPKTRSVRQIVCSSGFAGVSTPSINGPDLDLLLLLLLCTHFLCNHCALYFLFSIIINGQFNREIFCSKWGKYLHLVGFCVGIVVTLSRLIHAKSLRQRRHT